MDHACPLNYEMYTSLGYMDTCVRTQSPCIHLTPDILGAGGLTGPLATAFPRISTPRKGTPGWPNSGSQHGMILAVCHCGAGAFHKQARCVWFPNTHTHTQGVKTHTGHRKLQFASSNKSSSCQVRSAYSGHTYTFLGRENPRHLTPPAHRGYMCPILHQLLHMSHRSNLTIRESQFCTISTAIVARPQQSGLPVLKLHAEPALAPYHTVSLLRHEPSVMMLLLRSPRWAASSNASLPEVSTWHMRRGL